MSTDNGHIELERSVDSIRVGLRHRTELGDLASLAASIEREGLLQPITVTPEGILVCGARRLAAIKQLGWLHVKVWVRSGISGDLGYLLAEQDDNVLHKPLTQLENATLYREIKTLMAEDAARRQEASRFSRVNQPGDHGAANLAAPSEAVGDTREQAAAMIPDGPSHTTLEKINYLQHLVDDETQPESVREGVAAELELIGSGSAVHPSYERARQLVAAAQPERIRGRTRSARVSRGDQCVGAGYPSQSHQVVVGGADLAGGTGRIDRKQSAVGAGQDRAGGIDGQPVDVIECRGQCDARCGESAGGCSRRTGGLSGRASGHE